MLNTELLKNVASHFKHNHPLLSHFVTKIKRPPLPLNDVMFEWPLAICLCYLHGTFKTNMQRPFGEVLIIEAIHCIKN